MHPSHRRLKPRKGHAFIRKFRRTLAAGDAAQIDASVRGWINHVRYGDTLGLRRATLRGFNLLHDTPSA
jgi:hypothetical protein